MRIAGIVLLIIFILFMAFGLIPTMIMSYILYSILLVKNSPKKWGRISSFPEDEEYQRMFDEGMEWFGMHKEKKQDVEIKSEGFRLLGEYFDFGGKKAVIIIPGRTESLLYGYFFAEPYREAGYNVLVIDNRSHGLSEGKRSSLGQKEYKDILAWGKFLHEKFNVQGVVLHGICIGSSTALFALTDEACPEYMEAMVAEGMYNTFFESFKQHMILDKRPMFPIAYETMLMIRMFSGVNVVSDGPVKRIEKLKHPALFLHSRQDEFSLPRKAEELYSKCKAENTVVWFDTGAHSRIRINYHEKYDGAIREFLQTYGKRSERIKADEKGS